MRRRASLGGLSMFAGLAANLMAGDVVTADSLPAILPQLTQLFRSMGYKSDSSGKVFDG